MFSLETPDFSNKDQSKFEHLVKTGKGYYHPTIQSGPDSQTDPHQAHNT